MAHVDPVAEVLGSDVVGGQAERPGIDVHAGTVQQRIASAQFNTDDHRAALQSLVNEGDTVSDLDEQFAQAQADVKTLSRKPSNEDLLSLYALFKQGTVGDATKAKKPGRFDLVGKAKYEAWMKAVGMPADEAKTRYIAEVNRLLGR